MTSQTLSLAQQDSEALFQGCFRNRIINGDMRIDQRYSGAAVTPAVSSSYLVDRWRTAFAQPSKLTFQKNAGAIAPPAGFQSYFGVSVAAAYSSLLATDYFMIQQPIEAQNLSDLSWGTPDAAPVSLQFWVYVSVAGTYSGSLVNTLGTRSNVFTFNVPQANTWTLIKIQNIKGDTSGVWTFTGNSSGLFLDFCFGAGANYTSPSANSWQTTASFGYVAAAGCVNLLATAGAKFYITGVQFEKGAVCTPFENRPIGIELPLCQRYFEKSFAEGLPIQSGNGTSYTSVSWSQTVGANAYMSSNLIQYAATKRSINQAIATYCNGSAGGGSAPWNQTIGVACVAASVQSKSINGFNMAFTTAAGSSAGQSLQLDWTCDNEL